MVGFHPRLLVSAGATQASYDIIAAEEFQGATRSGGAIKQGPGISRVLPQTLPIATVSIESVRTGSHFVEPRRRSYEATVYTKSITLPPIARATASATNNVLSSVSHSGRRGNEQRRARLEESSAVASAT